MKTTSLKLKGKTAAYIDWANVYGWRKTLKGEPDPKKIFKYLSKYKQVKEISFYFGSDVHPKSKLFLDKIKKIGYRLITKPVKYLKVKIDSGEWIGRRKCDFDLEIGLDCFETQDKYDSFVFFSGDGDFATLYKRLIKRKKQVIVVYAKGHLGREIWEMKQGIFKVELPRLGKLDQPKKCPPTEGRGRD